MATLMPDFTDNPYFALMPRENPRPWTSTLGAMLAGLGAGISQASAARMPWYSGIGPGSLMASNLLSQQARQDEADRLRRFQLGLQAQGPAEEKAAPGMNFTPPATAGIQMGPQDSGGTSQAAPNQAGSLPAPKTKAEFDALPKGTRFKAPDGSERIKP
jgi:hypothetical protein